MYPDIYCVKVSAHNHRNIAVKKITFIAGMCVLASSALAFTTQEYLNDNAEQALRGFQVLPTQAEMGTRALGEKLPANGLRIKWARKFSASTQQYNTSYYQYYHGIRVLDGEVSIHEPKNHNSTTRSASQNKAIGQLVQDIEIDPKDLAKLNTPENLAAALADAKSEFSRTQAGIHWNIQNNQVDLVIKNRAGKLMPLYEASFYATAPNHVPVSYHALLDPAQKNKVLNAWNEVMSYADSGPGGNPKTQEYHYGVDGIPSLEVNKRRGKCELFDMSSNLMVVDMSKQDRRSSAYEHYITPYRYSCQSENRDFELDFDAYSAADDAYFFGRMVQDAYQEWYQTKVLDQPIIPLRVHYRQSPFQPYQGAHWDSTKKIMNFGDGGSDYYPLVSVDITAHEMSHGLTFAHSGLRYYDEPGCLNEAFSDMAAVMLNAYMQEKLPNLYQTIYHTPDMKWNMASAVIKNPSPDAAMRYFDIPSHDGKSADCYDARLPGVDQCRIDYTNVGFEAFTLFGRIGNSSDRNSYIVHTGSGIYNKFFYLLATTPGWDIKKAFNLMLVSNRDGYWGEYSGFQLAACQTIVAADDLGYEIAAVRNAFTKVGIDTKNCR
jgi:vibriolysin